MKRMRLRNYNGPQTLVTRTIGPNSKVATSGNFAIFAPHKANHDLTRKSQQLTELVRAREEGEAIRHP